jgi:spore coat polysaccharide biosynthesis predicted glycosyltransferase SpsG
MNIKVGLVYDYNSVVGMGHKYRVKALVEYLRRSGISYKEFPNFFYDIVHKNGDIAQFLEKISFEKVNIFVFDISTKLYIKENLKDIVSIIENLKSSGKKVVIIDGIFKEDCLHKNISTKSDLVVIPYFLSKGEEYKADKSNKFLLGEEYFIYPPAVNFIKSFKIKKEDFILVSLSGIFSKDIDKLLDFIGSDPFLSGFQFKVIIPEKKLKRIFNKKNIQVLSFLEHKSFLYLLRKAKLLITSTGLTKYEALSLHTPVVILSSDETFKDYHKKLEKFLPVKHCDNLGELPYLVEKLLSLKVNYDLPTEGGEKLCRTLKKL